MIEQFHLDKTGTRQGTIPCLAQSNAYDLLGDLRYLTDGNANTWQSACDKMGRLLREARIYKDGSGAWKTAVSRAYSYDGNVTKSQDALGWFCSSPILRF